MRSSITGCRKNSAAYWSEPTELFFFPFPFSHPFSSFFFPTAVNFIDRPAHGEGRVEKNSGRYLASSFYRSPLKLLSQHDCPNYVPPVQRVAKITPEPNSFVDLRQCRPNENWIRRPTISTNVFFNIIALITPSTKKIYLKT